MAANVDNKFHCAKNPRNPRNLRQKNIANYTDTFPVCAANVDNKFRRVKNPRNLRNPRQKNIAKRPPRQIAAQRKLKLRVLRCARERDHVADIRHACYEKHQAFEAETKTGMRAGTEFADLQIPPDGFFRDIHLFHTRE